MLRVYLMDRNGSARFVKSQPSPINEPLAICGWLAVYSAISKAEEGTQVKVKFKTEEGKKMTAVIVPGNNMIEIDVDENEIKLYMYIKDIIPDITRRI